MTQLPVLSGHEVVKSGHPETLSVPDHEEVARGTLRALLRAADLQAAEFLAP